MIEARHRDTALLVAACFFMEMLDGTIVTTASPQIGRALHAPATDVGLVVTAYLLTLAVLIPLSGWLTRRAGSRVVFLTAIAVFTLASAGCAASTSLGELVAMRVLQGAGGAMMVPVGRTMVVSRADKQDLLRITSYIVWPGLLAPVIAPLAGGLITTYASWHWMFLINVPLGAVAFTVAWRLVRDGQDATAPPPLDWAGVALTCAGLGGLTYAAHLVSLARPPLAPTAAVGAAGAVALAGAVWHLRRAAHPLVNLRTLQVHTFRLSQLGGSLYLLVVCATPFLLPLLFQLAFGKTAIESGAITFTGAIGAILMKVAARPVVQRFGFRRLLLGNAIIVGAATMALGLFRESTPIAVMIAVLTLSGFLRTLQFTCMSALTYADLAPAQLSGGTSIASVAQQISMSLGVAVGATLLHFASGFSSGGVSLSPMAFTATFAIVGLLPMASILVFARLSPEAGAEMAGRDTPTAAQAAPSSAAVTAPLEAAHESV